MLESVNAAEPVLLSVMFCAGLVVLISWLANVRLVGESVMAAVAPVPLRLTLCGLPLALSVIVMAPVRVPVAVGVNVTLIVQLPLAATDAPQVFVCA
jgi:hypothetical protein